MNKIVLSFLSLVALSTQAQAQTVFNVSGNIPGLKESMDVSLVSKDGYKDEPVAKGKVVNGQFALTDTLKHPSICELLFYRHGKDREGKPRRFLHQQIRLMVGAEPINMTVDTASFNRDAHHTFVESKVVWKGGTANEQYQQFLAATRSLEASADSASYAESRAWFANNGDDEAVKGYKERKNAWKAKYDKAVNDYLFARPNEWPTAAILSHRAYNSFQYSQQDYQKIFDLLKDSPDTAHVNFLNRNKDLIMAQATGVEYKDFKAMKTDNSDVAISSLMQAGKYTLIDFWASWCGPCRAAMPKIKAMLEANKNKLQVVSVSVDQKEEAWRKAEKEEAMPWPQLWLRGKDAGKTMNDYMIQSIPHLVLISPEGKIVLVTYDANLIKQRIEQI